MKRFISMLLASVMTFSTFGMVAFADDGQQAASAGDNTKAQTQSVAKESKVAVQDVASNDIGKLVYMSKKSFEYDPSGGELAEYDEKFSSVDTILSSIKYTEAGDESEFALDDEDDVTIRIGNTTYLYDDEKNIKRVLKPGKYTLVVTAKSPFSGALEFPFEVTPFKATKSTIDPVMNNNYYYYNGKAKCPTIKDVYLADAYAKLKKGTDYTVTYKYKNNKYFGTGTMIATIVFKGNATGTVVWKENIYIVPNGGRVKSAKAAKKSVKVKWTRSKNATGYKVLVYNANTGNPVKTKFIKGRKKTSCTIKGLKRHKGYCVTVSAYKQVKKKKVYTIKEGAKYFRTK